MYWLITFRTVKKLLVFHDITWKVYLKLLKIMQLWVNIRRVYTSHTHLKSKEGLYAHMKILLLSSGNDFSSVTAIELDENALGKHSETSQPHQQSNQRAVCKWPNRNTIRTTRGSHFHCHYCLMGLCCNFKAVGTYRKSFSSSPFALLQLLPPIRLNEKLLTPSSTKCF